MSYCVNCGVELGESLKSCPLCQTDVINPASPYDNSLPSFFPTRREEVGPVSKREAALLLTAMLASVALCCGVLNLFFYSDTWWSFFIAGAAFMFWIWFVPPLIIRNMPIWPRLFLDVCAVGIYVLLIALAVDGMDWYLGLILPIIICAAIIMPVLIWMLRRRQFSILTSAVFVLMSIAIFAISTELICDLYFSETWSLGWSLVILASCTGLSIPLIVVRRLPALREEVRRRFHL